MTGLAGAIGTTLRRSPAYARALPGKEIPGRACGAAIRVAEWRRSVNLPVCQAVHDAQAGRRRIRRSKARQGLFSVSRFSLLENGPVRVQNAEAVVPVGYGSALTLLDRTPEGAFRTRDIAVGQAGR